MAEIAHSQRLLRVRLVCRGCQFRPFSHANSPRLSLVCVYAWRFWPIVSVFVFSQRLLSLSASMHNTPLVCRGCKFRPFSHANSPRLSLVCVYAWRFWPIVSAFVFSQRQLSLSASMLLMHNTPANQAAITIIVSKQRCS